MKTSVQPEQELVQDSLRKPGILGWWYRLFAYHVPEGELATLKEQETIRRSRLATFVLVVQLLLIELPVVPIVMMAPNGAIVLPWLLGCLGILVLAFCFNRMGKLPIAGLLMVASIEITMIIKIWTLPGGITVSSLPQFDILIQPVLLAVVLLPPWSAFAVAGFNMLFILLSLFAGPHAPDLTAALANPHLRGDILVVPVMSQFIIATISFLVVSNLLSAIKRAGRAEQIARLQQAITREQNKFAQRNQELELGMNAIVQTLKDMANAQGTPERVTLPQGNVLWPVLQHLWRFWERYQRARQAERTLDATVQACTAVIQMLDDAREGRRATYPPRSNTPVDGIIMALMRSANVSQPRGTSGALTPRENSSV